MKTLAEHLVVFLCCIGSFSSAQDLGWVAIGPFEGSARNIRQLSAKLDNKMTLYAVTDTGILSYLGNALWRVDFPNIDDPDCAGRGKFYNGIWFSPHVDSLFFVAYTGCNIDPEPTLVRFYGIQNYQKVFGAGGVGASFNLIFDPLNDSVIYVDIIGLRISRNTGLTWFPDIFHDLNFNSPYFMTIDELTGLGIYGGGYDGVYVTVDTGKTARKVFDYGYERPGTDLLARNDTLVVAVGKRRGAPTADCGIFWSPDGSATWTQTLPNQNIRTLCRDPSYPLSLFAGGEKGIYFSADGGRGWSSYNNTLPSSRITDLTKDPFSDTLYVATSDLGAYKVFQYAVGVKDIPSFLPSHFRLYQNYPNPFNPSTAISYDLPTRSHVTLRIFNVLGQEVATLLNGEVEAGRHQEQWNAGRLASGVYFYRLQAGKFVENRKMILLR